MAGAVMDYPVTLALAYLALAGYLARITFACFRLPPPVAIFFVGLSMSYFMQEEILSARNDLQMLAFFLVLLNAGFEISIDEVSAQVVVMSLLPAACEILGIMIYGVYGLQFELIESFVLAITLFCLGEGIVIPRMNEFCRQFPKHPVPKMVLTWAPLEATFALTFFGILAGVSAPAHRPEADMSLLVLGSILRVVATLGAGAFVGWIAGLAITKRQTLKIRGRPIFSGTTVEAFLLICGTCLLVFGLGEGHVVPLPFLEGETFFQPELFVIVTASFFAYSVSHELLEAVEGVVTGVWIFGSLILFSMIGSKTEVKDLARLPKVIPIMVIGVIMRCIGIFAATYCSMGLQPCKCKGCVAANRAAAPYDAAFCFLATLPRATIQGALGAQPIQQEFFQNAPNKEEARVFIASTARLYILFFATSGTVLLELLGPRLLKATNQRIEACTECRRKAAHHGERNGCFFLNKCWPSSSMYYPDKNMGIVPTEDGVGTDDGPKGKEISLDEIAMEEAGPSADGRAVPFPHTWCEILSAQAVAAKRSHSLDSGDEAGNDARHCRRRRTLRC